MHLKRIELAGFKSFAKRIELDFRPGVTAVVGPNGSGKSNISDAVRWVLGEQSAKSLRGAKMEDVIFAGSEGENHRNVAEVTLVLDNRDEQLRLPYEEVSVTRRVTRSGDSDYFMNKKPCRLKDVIDLFLDTGLSRDAFAIIGQGRVEQVISGKPEDRRAVIEEAAGVLKYRQRKKQAERKLQDTELNLSRVDDILFELADRVEPLREQAALAREYKVAKARHDELETGIMGAEIQMLQQEIEQVTVRHTESIQQLSNSDRSVQNLTEERSQLEATLSTLRDELAELNQKEREQSTYVERLTGDIKLAKAQEEHGAEMKDRLLRQREEVKAEMAELETRLQTVRDELSQKVDTLRQTTEARDALQQQLTAASRDFNSEIEALQSEAFELATTRATISNQQKREQRDIDVAIESKERLLRENKHRLDDRSSQEATLLAAQKQYEEVQSRFEQLTDKEAELHDQETTIREKLTRAETSYYDLERRRQKTEDRIEMLERMKQSYEGYFHAVKFVLKNRSAGVLGAVAELIRVRPSYEAAIETALGQTQQHVVVTDETVGRREIDQLRKANAGRATFLPLTTIKPRFVPTEVMHRLESMNGFVGVASDLVETDESFETLKQSLLGAVLVAETLEVANRMAQSTGYRFRVVTLEGDIVNVGGSMTGGSRKQGVALFTQSRELDDLKQGLTQGLAMLHEQKQRLQEYTEALTTITQALSTLRDEKRTVEVTLRDVEATYRTAERASLDAKSQLELFDHEMMRYERTIETSTAELERLTKALADTDKEQADIRVRLESLRAEQSKSAESTGQLETALRQNELDLQRHTLEEERVRYELERLTTELNRLQERNNQMERELTRLDSGEVVSSAELEATLTTAKLEFNEIQESLQAMATTLKSNEEAYRIMRQRVDQATEARRQAEAVVRKLETAKQEFELKRQWKLDALEEQGLVAELLPALEIPLDEAKEEFKLLVRQIEEIGPVNLNAIEEFDSVHERFTFLSEQRDDLVSAKEDLYEIIAEMDREVTRLFKETYTNVRAHFKQTFTELFGGGEADLKLVDESDLLNTGIEIVAKPPGKKLQTLSLLSGGERALTAIALLFAILKTRPVPFCVLDEVEAALDEANVHRFGEYIRTLSIDTQFVIITHRKGTMEAADTLYGVTMQQNGVSEVLSVELSEAKRVVEMDEEMEESR
ncbi:chromosome segregation protein SMC [Exiguobacterium aestuarii]|uniref:Chromosome partition protein Smc n=1 Tax=Exiguobacterium aestuarii TaxID=273527 RepID=A0ABW2PRE8_9BACL|nr:MULTISPECIES: chromosome segregation protein SMC [Exiguobacterium]MCT4785777.1 chromosome segregation protein SMC [Exiguobacterium aestuarii]